MIHWIVDSLFITRLYTLHIRNAILSGSNKMKMLSSVQFSRSVVSNSLRPHLKKIIKKKNEGTRMKRKWCNDPSYLWTLVWGTEQQWGGSNEHNPVILSLTANPLEWGAQYGLMIFSTSILPSISISVKLIVSSGRNYNHSK